MMAELNGQLNERNNKIGTFDLDIDNANGPVGTYTFTMGYKKGLHDGFSIFTGTLTNATVVIKAQNNDNITAVNITEDLYGVGVSQLADNGAYITDINVPVEKIIVEINITDPTNLVQLSLYGTQTQ